MKYGKKIVLLTLFAMNLVDQPAPEVTIEQGILSGKVSPDGSFFQYLGIPYATTNSSTRFKAPLPPPSWDGVFKAIDEIYACPQMGPFGIVYGTEDCLKINIYVPSTAKKPLPVMVFIHGGAFMFGSGGQLIYGADFIVKHDVILVTFNYRLGALGFTCLNIKEAPGNAGLKDQIAALRWIKRNIAAFSGDPNNITLFGQSAGGVATSVLTASEATEGLFNKAIVHSGSSIANWAINRDPVWTAGLIAKDLGYDTSDPYELHKIFSSIPYWELAAAYPKKPLGKYLYTEILHLPCVEKPFPGEEAVIEDLPYNLMRKKAKNIPLIYGTTSSEGLIFSSVITSDSIEERNGKFLLTSDLAFASEEEAERVDNKTRQMYFGEEGISIDKHAAVMNLLMDLHFQSPAVLETEIMLEKNTAPVFNYYFDYAGGRNFFKFLLGHKDDNGAAHGDEMFYLFRGRLFPLLFYESDRKMIEFMTKMWTNFAKYSDPTPDISDLPVKWTPSRKDKLNFLYIDAEMKMGPIPNMATYQLWKDIYEKYRDTNLTGTK